MPLNYVNATIVPEGLIMSCLYDENDNPIACEARNCDKYATSLVADQMDALHKLCTDHAMALLAKSKGKQVECANCHCKFKV